MRGKALILELAPSYCLAMEEDGAVVRIRRKKGVRVGDRIYLLEEDLWQGEAPAARTVQRLSGMAAALALCLALLFWNLSPGAAACALLSLDGERSVQVELDASNVILSAVLLRGNPPDGGLSALTGQTLAEALPALRRVAGGDALVAGCAPLRDDWQEAGLRAVLDEAGILCLVGDAADVEAARDREESLGLYMASRVLAGTRTPDDLPDQALDTLERVLGLPQGHGGPPAPTPPVPTPTPAVSVPPSPQPRPEVHPPVPPEETEEDDIHADVRTEPEGEAPEEEPPPEKPAEPTGPREPEETDAAEDPEEAGDPAETQPPAGAGDPADPAETEAPEETELPDEADPAEPDETEPTPEAGDPAEPDEPEEPGSPDDDGGPGDSDPGETEEED